MSNRTIPNRGFLITTIGFSELEFFTPETVNRRLLKHDLHVRKISTLSYFRRFRCHNRWNSPHDETVGLCV